MVLTAVKENRLYIHTDRVMEKYIKARTKALLDALEGHPWRCFIILSLRLGIRRAELLALRLQCIACAIGRRRCGAACSRAEIAVSEPPQSRF